MSVIRVLRTAAATLTRTLFVDETATDASGPVTVSVSRTADGAVVAAGTASHGTTGVYTYILPGGPAAPSSATWQLDELTVMWTGTVAGATVSLYDEAEVVGGYLFGLAEARASDASLADLSKYPTSALAACRVEVEQECERICRRAFVPRFGRDILSGDGGPRLGAKRSELRVLRAVSVSGVAWSALDVAAVGLSEHGVLTRPGGAPWPAGVQNVVVEYEHGWDRPPEMIRTAAKLRLRSKLNAARSGIPDRASSYTSSEGAVFRLSMPGPESTGIPEVDGPYQTFARRRRSVVA